MSDPITYRADDGSLRQCTLVEQSPDQDSTVRAEGSIKDIDVRWNGGTFTARDVQSSNLITVQPMPGPWVQVSVWCPPVLVEEPRKFRVKGIGW